MKQSSLWQDMVCLLWWNSWNQGTIEPGFSGQSDLWWRLAWVFSISESGMRHGAALLAQTPCPWLTGSNRPSLPAGRWTRPPVGRFALSRSVSFHRLLYRSGGTFPSKQLTNQQGDLMLKTCTQETGSFKQTLHADTICIQTSIADHVTLSLEWTAILCVPATTL